MLRFRIGSCFFCAVMLAWIAGSAEAQEPAPLTLLNLADPASARLAQPSSNAVTVERIDQAGVCGLLVKIVPSDDAYPGVRIVPATGNSWDLQPYGGVEAVVTNTDSQPLRLCFRVDNPSGSRGGAWNTTYATLSPGQTKAVRLMFGDPSAYPLQPIAIARVLLFTNKATAAESFRIEGLRAVGAPLGVFSAERAMNRLRPDRGLLLGEGVEINAASRLKFDGGATGSMRGSALIVQSPEGATAKTSVSLVPPQGLWHLGDANQIVIELANDGQVPLTPSVTVESDWGGSVKAVGSPMQPGGRQKLTLSFTPTQPWEGVWTPPDKNATELSKLSGGTANATKPGTGTQFSSDKVKLIRFTAEHSGAASFVVESITASQTLETLPAWVGQRPPVDGSWVRTFSEEFEGAGIDAQKWNIKGPNYWDNLSHWSAANVLLDHGTVRLRSEKKEGPHNDEASGAVTPIAAGFLTTLDHFSQRYGYFEARMKVPTTAGLWPAFWLMPDRGATVTPRAKRFTTSDGGMEFDIMESLTGWGPNRYNIAAHWDDYGADHKHIGTGKVYVQPDAQGFVTSGLLWLPGQATFYCNGKVVGRWEDARVSNVPSYILFTMPVGGWDANALTPSSLPADFVIDYVRVWQRQDLMQPPASGAATTR